MSEYKGFQRIVGCCNDCPNMEIESTKKRDCFKYECWGVIPHKLIFEGLNNMITPFPEWCPLEDVDL